MKFLVVFSVFLVLVTGSTHDDANKEFKSGMESRVINGLPAATHQFPYQAFLFCVRSMSEIVECSGVLISPRWVLTTAQCTKGYIYDSVALGSSTNNDADIRIESSILISHENYSTSYLNNDIGLIDLEQELNLSEKVNIIRLLGKDSLSNTFVGDTAQISGYGKLSNSDLSTQPSFYFGNVTIVSNEECTKYYGSKAITSATICTKGPSTGEFNMCRGDQGGPLTGWNESGEPVLLGLVSFGDSRGCDTDSPSAYIRPDHYIDWINEITGLSF